LAVALLPAAWLCRRYGDAHVGAAGMALFCLASLGCGGAEPPRPPLLLPGVPGLGGAAGPGRGLRALRAGPPAPRARGWCAAAGPALGGALTQAFSWRAIFFAQAPIALPGMLVAFQAARTEVPVPDDGRDPDQPSGPLPWRPATALGLLSASLTAVIFLVVLMLVSGWSIEPLAAALAVSVLPVAAIASSRLPGGSETRAIARCLLVAGGVGCLALIPGP